MTSAPSIIRARGLTKHYGRFVAVDGIDFDVRPGECFGLLGPNGAGKSSAIRMVCATSPVTAGVLEVCGMPVQTEPRAVKSLIGVVPQDDTLDEDFPVLQSLTVYGRYFGMPAEVARERALRALSVVQLADRRTVRVDTLSGGMKRRLLIARALVNEPVLLVLDEPTTGLDPQSRHLVWDELFALRHQGITILLTTHHMEEAAVLCDRIVIMDHGRILVEGTPQEVVRRHAGTDVWEVRPKPGAEDAARARLEALHVECQRGGRAWYAFAPDGALRADGPLASLAEVSQRPANLEDVFLRLTGRELRDE